MRDLKVEVNEKTLPVAFDHGIDDPLQYWLGHGVNSDAILSLKKIIMRRSAAIIHAGGPKLMMSKMRTAARLRFDVHSELCGWMDEWNIPFSKRRTARASRRLQRLYAKIPHVPYVDCPTGEFATPAMAEAHVSQLSSGLQPPMAPNPRKGIRRAWRGLSEIDKKIVDLLRPRECFTKHGEIVNRIASTSKSVSESLSRLSEDGKVEHRGDRGGYQLTNEYREELDRQHYSQN